MAGLTQTKKASEQGCFSVLLSSCFDYVRSTPYLYAQIQVSSHQHGLHWLLPLSLVGVIARVCLLVMELAVTLAALGWRPLPET